MPVFAPALGGCHDLLYLLLGPGFPDKCCLKNLGEKFEVEAPVSENRRERAGICSQSYRAPERLASTVLVAIFMAALREQYPVFASSGPKFAGAFSCIDGFLRSVIAQEQCGIRIPGFYVVVVRSNGC